jgi:hypothetical protein
VIALHQQLVLVTRVLLIAARASRQTSISLRLNDKRAGEKRKKASRVQFVGMMRADEGVVLSVHEESRDEATAHHGYRVQFAANRRKHKQNGWSLSPIDAKREKERDEGGAKART